MLPGTAVVLVEFMSVICMFACLKYIVYLKHLGTWVDELVVDSSSTKGELEYVDEIYVKLYYICIAIG